MKLSFLTLLAKRYPLEYSFRLASEIRFDGVEIWGARPHAYPFDIDEDTAAQIRSLSKRFHVEIPMYTPELLAYPYNLASSSEKERDDTIRYLKTAVRASAMMDCPAMLVSCDHPGYGRDAAECWQYLTQGLREVCTEAEKQGIAIRMEPLGLNTSPIVSNSDDLVRLIQDVDSPAFGAMMDMAIPPLVAEPFSEYTDKIPGGIDYIHLCGCDGIYETHLQITGGDVSFPVLFEILKSRGYDGWCSVEILEPYYRDPELYLRQAMAFLRTII